MSLTRQEIIDYAMQYVNKDEITDFPMNGDLFCILQRTLPENRILKDDEGWQFSGYQVCVGYMLDDEAKPMGKWMWMQFVSLRSFPPKPETLKLQPPHIVKGTYQDGSRTHEFRIIKLDVKQNRPSYADETESATPAPQNAKSGERPSNILQFPTKRKKRTPGSENPDPDSGGSGGRSA